MTDAPLLPPAAAGGLRPRGPLALALHLYRTDSVWRGAIDIVWIGTAVAVLTFGMPDLLPDLHRPSAPSPPAANTTTSAPSAAPLTPAPIARGARTLNDFQRYELEHALVWAAAPDAERVMRLKEAWRATLARDGAIARGMFEGEANAGDPNAQFIMAAVMLTESGLQQRFADAEPWLKKAADQGQPMAMYWLGVHGLKGLGEHPVDKTAALDLLRRAEALGYGEAGDQLCRVYLEGNGVTADAAEAVTHCRRGAELGSGWAMNRLGYCYSNGRGVARDSAAAFQWISKAAATGLPPAERNLGMAHLNGIGTPQDPARAIEWLARSAEHGDVDSFIQLGIIYRDGRGGAIDLPKAATWFRKAAVKGSAHGQYLYATALEQGRGTNPDKVQAHVYYSLAALQAYAGAEAGMSRLKGQLSADELDRATRMADALRTRKPIE